MNRRPLAIAQLTVLCLGFNCKSVTPAQTSDQAAAFARAESGRPAARNAPACNLSTDPARAYCIFESLTDATTTWDASGGEKMRGDQNAPLWENWDDKCNLGLADCDEEKANSKASKPLAPADLLAAAMPIQLMSEQAIGMHALAASKSDFASVLFSPEIAGPIRSYKLNTQATLDGQLARADKLHRRGHWREIDTPIEPNAIVTKLIWEAVLAKPQNVLNSFPARVYDDNIRLDPRDMSTWPFYEVDGEKNSKCEDVGPPLPSDTLQGEAWKAKPISVNCFYHHVVDAPLGSAIYRQMNDALRTTTTTGGVLPPGNEVILLLVGAHFMQFNQAHQTWQWMTFYWKRNATGNPETSRWMNPWKHYEMMTVSAPGELRTPVPNRPVANPYLEGHTGAHGAETNCISCHSLAAYDRKLSFFPAAVQFANNNVRPYPNTEKVVEDRGGFDQAVRTHFLWSLVTNPSLRKEP